MIKKTSYPINLNFKVNAKLIGSNEIDNLLMVSSHERSGTHFMMNSIATCTNYISNSIINFDYNPFGSYVNFFREEKVHEFFKSLSEIKSDIGTLCVSNIIKSHFPVEILGEKPPESLKIIYIYRNPVDVFISFWKFLNNQKYFEGPKTTTPLDLARHVPSGRSQRYQIKSYSSYFERWAKHVESACTYAQKNNSMILVTYQELLKSHESSIQKICKSFDIKKLCPAELPSEEDFKIEGLTLKLAAEEKLKLTEYCLQEIEKFENLPMDIMYA